MECCGSIQVALALRPIGGFATWNDILLSACHNHICAIHAPIPEASYGSVISCSSLSILERILSTTRCLVNIGRRRYVLIFDQLDNYEAAERSIRPSIPMKMSIGILSRTKTTKIFGLRQENLVSFSTVHMHLCRLTSGFTSGVRQQLPSQRSSIQYTDDPRNTYCTKTRR